MPIKCIIETEGTSPPHPLWGKSLRVIAILVACGAFHPLLYFTNSFIYFITYPRELIPGDVFALIYQILTNLITFVSSG